MATASAAPSAPSLPRWLLAPGGRASQPLLGLLLATVVLASLAAAGLLFDPRLITGAPAWQKPLKFALSVAIYAVSTAWLLGQVRAARRTLQALEWVTTVTLGLELALIFLQAARGQSSHFNLTSALNKAVFSAMGVLIAVLWVAQLVTAALLLRQRFADPATAWALRLGMALTVLGAGVGWLMVTPTSAQLAGMARGVFVASGSHSVGGADGGPGLAFVGWSREHGDLRAAHFFGMHALQLLPLLAFLLGRTARLLAAQRARLLLAGAASYGALFLLLLVQALREKALVSLDALAWAALGAWLLGTVAGAAIALGPPRRAQAPAPAGESR